MNIDATIIIQIINFWILYIALKHIIWKDLIDVINWDRIHKRDRDQKLALQKSEIDKQITEIDMRWKSFQTYCLVNQPASLERHIFLPTFSISVPCKMNSNDITYLKNQYKSVMLEWMLRKEK